MTETLRRANRALGKGPQYGRLMVVLLLMIVVGLGGAALFRVVDSRARSHPIAGASVPGVVVLVAAAAAVVCLYQLG